MTQFARNNEGGKLVNTSSAGTLQDAIFRRMDALLFEVSRGAGLGLITRGTRKNTEDYGKAITALESSVARLSATRRESIKESLDELKMVFGMLHDIQASDNAEAKAALDETPELTKGQQALIDGVDSAIKEYVLTKMKSSSAKKTGAELEQDMKLQKQMHDLYDLRFTILLDAGLSEKVKALGSSGFGASVAGMDKHKSNMENLMCPLPPPPGSDLEEITGSMIGRFSRNARGATSQSDKSTPKNHDEGKLSDRSTSILGAIVRFFESIIRSHEIKTFEKKEQLAKDPLYEAARDLATTLETKLSKHLKSHGKELDLKGTLSADERFRRLYDILYESEIRSTDHLIETTLKDIFEEVAVSPGGAACGKPDQFVSEHTAGLLAHLRQALESYPEFAKNPREQQNEKTSEQSNLENDMTNTLKSLNKALGGRVHSAQR